jgi:hypothetical protein
LKIQLRWERNLRSFKPAKRPSGGTTSAEVKAYAAPDGAWEMILVSVATNMPRRWRYFGVRWQAKRDTAFEALEFPVALNHAKAPSPLRSAGAVPNT